MPIYSNELISLIFTVLGLLSVILFGVIGFAEGKKKEEEEEEEEQEEEEEEEDDDDKDKKKDKDKKFDKAYVHELREEAKGLRLKLKKIDEAKTDAEKKKLKEEEKYKELAEKTEEEKKDLLEKFKQKMVNVELMLEGRKAKIIDEELAVLANRDKVEVDDEFNVKGAADAIKALKESKPKYFQKEDDDSDDDDSGDDKEPEPSDKPGLKGKIFKSQEKSSRQSIADGLKTKKKKKR